MTIRPWHLAAFVGLLTVPEAIPYIIAAVVIGSVAFVYARFIYRSFP